MLSKREKSIADRKQRILEAARSIIATDGFDALTTRGIAEMAGVTPPTLYNLVGDKTAIISAMAAASIEELWYRLEFDRRGTPLGMADAVIDEAYAQLMEQPEFSRASLLALDRVGIAFAYDPLREDAGAYAARRSVQMAQHACEAAIEAGQLRGNLDPHELGLQMFAAYRAALDDWLHEAIDTDEMLRRQRIGFYTVLSADASDEFRDELIARISALTKSARDAARPRSEKEAA